MNLNLTDSAYIARVTAITAAGPTYTPPTVNGGVMSYYSTNSVVTFTSNATMSITGSGQFDILVVGGGGGGGGNIGGGGAGGGVKYTASLALTGGVYYITVGAGGAGAPGGNNLGSNGKSSSFASSSGTIYLKTCGGIGGHQYTSAGGVGNDGGGSGGQGDSNQGIPMAPGQTGSYNNINGSGSYWGGGGGGAASNSGLGLETIGALGGPSGGAKGDNWNASVSDNAPANLGGGGGGAPWINVVSITAGNGGSGVVIVAFRNT